MRKGNLADMTLELDIDFGPPSSRADTLTRTPLYPRLRFMGSKYKVVPHLVRILSDLSFENALDGFSGSGVVAYALKEMGKEVVANDFLRFPATVATALIQNPGVVLDAEDIEALLSPNADGRDFIRRTFE